MFSQLKKSKIKFFSYILTLIILTACTERSGLKDNTTIESSIRHEKSDIYSIKKSMNNPKNTVSTEGITQDPAAIDATIKDFLDQILDDNNHHMHTIKKEEYKKFKNRQSPRATVLMCSDSRVQTKAITKMDVNDLFVVRNIGNQVINSSGSIEFGIRFLNTPVLLIIGHSGCGAIEAVLSNVDVENGCIERELEPIDVTGDSLNDAVIQNVDNQVKFAVRKFKKLIEQKKLLVVGAIYDFQDAYKKGLGKLIIVSLNGNKDPSVILESEYFTGNKNLVTIK